MRRTVLGPVAAVVAPVYLAGCFHYVPVDAAWTPPAGTDIRVTLASPAPFNLGTFTVHDVQAVEGKVVEAAADSVGVWVKWLHPLVGEKYDANSAEFYLPRSSIARMERLRISGGQTALLVAASAALVAGLSALVSAAVGQNGSGGGDLPPPAARIGR
jgi:hypothetical protein